MEGDDYIRFQGKKITIDVAKENYNFWKEKGKIPEPFDLAHQIIYEDVKKIHGANTFAARKNTPHGISYPLFNIFSFDERTKKFEHSTNCGLKCDKILRGNGDHMRVARELGLDGFVFSYLGVHLPYHRQDDTPPVCPFGVFLKPTEYAYTHGTPNDRSYIKTKNDADTENIDKYVLTPDDLKRVITNRIVNDTFFDNSFWKYYGNPDYWEDSFYRENQWKKKAEYCFFETAGPSNIAAILWPVWEERADGGGFHVNELYDLIPSFKKAFDIDVIIYRPYRDIVNKENWESQNQRDWEISLIEASYLAHKYYNVNGFFPDDILTAKIFFQNIA